MAGKVRFRPAARRDLFDIYAYVAGEAGRERAGAYISRIEGACLALAEFPERGTLRDDLRPGLRVIGFERRVAIVFRVEDDGTVQIGRVLYGGRDLAALSIDPEA